MIYVTSDLHGCSPSDFQKLLRQVGFQSDDYLFILGDVIDRGPWGAELLLWLTQQPNMQLILGNHEALLLACSFLFREVTADSLDRLSVKDITLVQDWMDNGGAPTIKGFQKLLRADPDTVEGILDYLQDAPLYEDLYVNGRRFILAHAGLGNFRDDRPLDDYSPLELLMDRPTLQTRYFPNARVIFGHTPSRLFAEEYHSRTVHTDTWTCIDIGFDSGRAPMVLRLDDMKEFYLQ